MEELTLTLPPVVIGGRQFEFSRFLKDERFVVGDEMLTRAEAMGNLADPFHSEGFLVNQNDIPAGCRQFALMFAGKVRNGPRGYRGVVCLGWCAHFGKWIPFPYWLGWGFSDFFRLVRLVPALTFAKHLAFPSL